MANKKDLILLDIKKELARRNFYYYCKLFAPDFYKKDRLFLTDLCNKLQQFVENPFKKIMVINMPPRHGKSRTVGMLVQWLLGVDKTYTIMTGSYNEKLSSKFAKTVRDFIASEKTAGTTVYNDIFPQTRIKYGEASANAWALQGNSVANYLATSPTGTATGFGAKLIIVDDLIKNSMEAHNGSVKESHIDWFVNTMLSRGEKNFKIIIISTRWATDDLSGFILDNFDNVEHVNYKAQNEDGTMLCDEILSLEEYEFKIKNMDKSIVLANYQQEPINVRGALYQKYKTYTTITTDKIVKIASYCDTADTGKDYLCNIVYADCTDSAYILDVVYTKDPMEITESMVAQSLTRFGVNNAYIESNNGGRSFSRNVERIARELGNYKTYFEPFHQTANKQSRILSNSSWVENNIYYPNDWANKFPEFYKAVVNYQREGKNLNDDAVDALTGIAEKMTQIKSIIFGI